MDVTGRRQLMWSVNVEERVLQSFEENLNTSTQVIAQQLGVCQSSLQREVVHPYHLQRMQLAAYRLTEASIICTMVHA
ncbi:hypothetical protein TNCV_273741 [Trichonephila clavipes]|nr:hypothetical protein TNCV_273741 [Trichonephila clavipes]